MNKIGIDKTYEVVEAVTKMYPDFKMPKILARKNLESLLNSKLLILK